MKSPLNYFGGKSKLSKVIIPMIPKDHVCYCEPTSGAAWVLFGKEPSHVEVLNDGDSELVTFWRVVQNHLQPFLEYFRFAVISRKLFELEKKKDPTTLTDIQRAVRYYYLQRLTFGGKTKGRTFGSGAIKPMNLNLATIEEVMLEVHWRLQRVTVEHLDALECIRRYDRPTTFFYIDPPYFFNRNDYAVPFEKFDELAAVLKGLKGTFILSLNDCKEVRKLFSWAAQKRVTLTYSSQNPRTNEESRSTPRTELLIHRLKR